MVDEVTKFITGSSYLAKVDLKAAYRSIPIKKNCYELTGIQWLFGDSTVPMYLFDAKLPFGAAKSCFIFQSVTDAVCRILLRHGFRAMSYIDDFICVGDSELSCKACFDFLIEMLESLGLLINWKKVSEPVRVIQFLGVQIDCELRTLSLPSRKVEEVCVLVKAVLTRENLKR